MDERLPLRFIRSARWNKFTDNMLDEIVVTNRTLIIVCFSFWKLNALNGRLQIKFVGSEEKWAFLEEFNFFKCRYLTSRARNFKLEFHVWISYNALPLVHWIDNCISVKLPLAPYLVAPGIGYYWIWILVISSCSLGGGLLALYLPFRNNITFYSTLSYTSRPY